MKIYDIHATPYFNSSGRAGLWMAAIGICSQLGCWYWYKQAVLAEIRLRPGMDAGLPAFLGVLAAGLTLWGLALLLIGRSYNGVLIERDQQAKSSPAQMDIWQ